MEAIGYNTLVIELLAKNLNEFNNDIKDHYPLAKLLEDIQQKGVLSIRKSTKVNANCKLQRAKPEDIIRSMYDISQLSDNEKQVLSIYALLPATSISFKYLESFLPNIEELDRVLLRLSQKGWVDYDKELKSFKTNPIISEIAREQNKSRLEEDTLSLLVLLIDKLNYEPGIGHIEGDFDEIKIFVLYAETVLNNFEILNFNKSILCNRLGNFYKTYGNLDKALTLFEEYSRLGKELYEFNPNEEGFKNGLAISYMKLGDTHTSLGNLERAMIFFEDELKLSKELYESDPNNMSFKNGLAISYEKLGETHKLLGSYDKALTFFEERSRIGKELYGSHPNSVGFKNGLAISYEKLGNTHKELGDLDKALTFFEERSRIGKSLYESNPNNVGFKNGLAISYSKLGETHKDLGNLEKALTFFEDDMRLTKELYESNPNNVGFKNGLAVSYSKLGNTHKELGDLDKALTFFEERLRIGKSLYESNPNNVGFKNGLAISYTKLGALFIDNLNDETKGRDFLNRASELLRDLVEKYPMYAEFEKNYNWVVDKIKSIE